MKAKNSKYLSFAPPRTPKRIKISFSQYGKCSGESSRQVPNIFTGNSSWESRMDQPDEFCPPHASEAVAEQKRAEQANRKRKMAPPTSVRPPTKVSKVGRSMAGASASIKARVVPPPSRPDLFSSSPTKSE